MLFNEDGSKGVLGGPHKIFTDIHRHYFDNSKQNSFFANQYRIYRTGYQVNPDISLLGFKEDVRKSICDNIHHQNNNFNESNIDRKSHVIKSQRIFGQIEDTGSEITYRCVNCRSCKVCKNHEEIEAISVREEVEQSIIIVSVKVDISNKITIPSLPFIHDPLIKLAPNKSKALKVYQQQLRKLNNPDNQKDKADVLESESKLQRLGHVEYVKNLPTETQIKLRDNPIQNFIPWRAVWKNSSISTPCRIVFDASQATNSGFSLNDVLAKGRNNMNKLQEILIRWCIHKVAIHTDVKKMYNTVKLQETDWCYQRFIWEQNLDPTKIPEEKVIKTLIYGVKFSGNQAEYGLRETARLSKDKFPEVSNIIHKDMYVDDCITGEISKDVALVRSNQLEIVLNRGGFELKGVSFSGEPPPETLSDDGISIHIAGMKWYPKDDFISLHLNEMNFSKRNRGRKITSSANIIPSKLTRIHCVARVAELFDLTGKLTPITASMKLDLQELVTRRLDWDDTIPDELRPVWESNFEMMQEINSLKYKRAIVPDDAVDLNINTIDAGDASQSLACAAVYARFKRQNGEYSCQLVLARSRIIPKGMSQPRAELYAALLNSHTGEIVRRSFKDWHKSAIKLTDSQITLHWISNDEKPLKQWTRNRVIEISRYTSSDQWFYVQSKNMIADLGTRKGATLKDISQTSEWINGLEWMKLESAKFPMKSVKEIRLNEKELNEIQKEVPSPKSTNVSTSYNTNVKQKIPEAVSERYAFSNYLVDPNYHRFKTVVRILALVMRFCNILLCRVRKLSPSNVSTAKVAENTNQIYLSDEEINRAEMYFFKKCSLEIKHFLSTKKYQNITKEKDGVLMYTGRILSSDNISVVGQFTDAMKDLTSTTFCVPVIEKNSPVAYGLVNEIHWYDKTAKHAGIEIISRSVLKKAYIIEGRSVIKLIKSSCERCRYLGKRTINVTMGPVSRFNLTIAPAFYISQVDLCGPFKAYSPHQKRTTVKIWLIVFCCATTSCTNIKVMDDCSTTSFIQAFTRFSCDVGFPMIILCDEGSQLVHGCQSMKLSFNDIKYRLHHDVAVEFEICPVGGHNMHGKVERKIREINSSIDKTISNERLSIIQWETIAAEIANSINDLPLALGNVTSDFENMDLITLNRLRLGRNNDRSPTGNMVLVNDPSRIIKENLKVFNSWFQCWLLCHVPQLMQQQKWFANDPPLKVGDVVLFLKQESCISSNYQYGLVQSIEESADGIVRKIKVKYRNSHENTFKETYRSARKLVVIHRIDEIDLMKELGEIACVADIRLRMEIDSK